MMLLIESNFNVITEKSDEDKKLYLKGVFLEAEQKNRNGRVYKLGEIKRAAEKINTAAKEGHHILGELDHPPNLEVQLKNVSHKIIGMKMEGNNAVGKAEILTSTPSGKIAEGLIDAKINIGVSSRGSGAVKENGVVEDFELITVDLVANPSAIKAYPSSVLEHLDYYKRRTQLLEIADIVTHDPKAQKYFQAELKKFLNELFD